jgi:hypothetical protein
MKKAPGLGEPWQASSDVWRCGVERSLGICFSQEAHMMLVRELMYRKPGKVKPLVQKFVAMAKLMEKAGRQRCAS